MGTRHKKMLIALSIFGMLVMMPAFPFAIFCAVIFGLQGHLQFKKASQFELWTRQFLAKEDSPSRTPYSPSKSDELEKLHALKEKGVINESEFSSEKNKILGKAA